MEVARGEEVKVVPREGEARGVVTDPAPDRLVTVSAQVVVTKYHMCQVSAVVTVPVPGAG